MSNCSGFSLIRTFIALLVVGIAGACANNATSGPEETPAVANPGAAWEDGARAVDTGEAMVTRGEKRLELGRQQVRQGEAQIRNGNERAEMARQEYAVAASNNSATRQEQASMLRAIGGRWEKAIQEIKGGNELVAKGKANIDRGEAEIREGRSLMETGSILMRNAHRSRLGLSLLPMPQN